MFSIPGRRQIMDDLIPIEDPTTGGCDFGKKSFLSGVRDT
jgi:hypothetical protein